MDELRQAYERGYGVGGQGAWWWFLAWHAPTAPCWKCGVVTDRWVVGLVTIGSQRYGTPHVDQPLGDPHELVMRRGLRWETQYPFCWSCEVVASIASLAVRQQNIAILESVRVGEAKYLAELKAEHLKEAA